MMRQTYGGRLIVVFLAVWTLIAPALGAEGVTIGAATYFLSPKTGDNAVPKAPYRTEAMLKTAAQTNQWYSSLLFNAKPEVLFAIPLSFKPTSAGFEMALPGKVVVPTERRDVEIHYPHRDPLVFSPVAFEPGHAKLAKASDWSIDIAMDNGTDRMLVTITHASPFAYFQLSRGDIRLRLPAGASTFTTGTDSRILGIKVNDKTYAVFGPSGVRWESAAGNEWIGRLPSGAGYFSAAALPDDKAETLRLFSRHAYAFVQDTKTEWRYDQASSKVETTFTTSTRIMEGADNGPLIGLYPHQWANNASIEDKLGATFDSIRGKVRLLAAPQFKTEYTYHGFVPYWPGIHASDRLSELKSLLKTDQRKARPMMLESGILGTDPYSQGKGLARITKLMDVAEQQGDLETRDRLLALAKKRIEAWFSGDDGKTYFHYDKSLGTMVGYPEQYFSVVQMNDHHFHFGYWIRAMADIALRDPAWAAKNQWGGMVDLLIADIATSQRGRADFPFLRNFDPYEGHSWASGIGLGPYGNNQESSSEAVNAWAGLILWGEINGDRELRDLGIYLYTTEIEAINHYWFDLNRQVFAPEYMNTEVSMLFGGKYAHNTWWTDEPRQIHGINLLPITTSSTYLGRDPAFVKRNLDAIHGESEIYASRGKRPNPPDIWQDIFAKYQALTDPQAGLSHWDRWGAVELGDTRTHTLHWLLSLKEMGTPDFGITANTPLYSVFKRADGKMTYLAYNAGKTPITVRFSDGKTLTVAPASLGRSD